MPAEWRSKCELYHTFHAASLSWSNNSKKSTYTVNMKKTAHLIILLCSSLPAMAELKALDSEQLEQARTATNITAFSAKESIAPDIIDPIDLNDPGNNELRIQQEVNDINIRIISSIPRSTNVQLDNQLLQGPSSGVEIRSNTLNY